MEGGFVGKEQHFSASTVQTYRGGRKWPLFWSFWPQAGHIPQSYSGGSDGGLVIPVQSHDNFPRGETARNSTNESSEQKIPVDLFYEPTAFPVSKILCLPYAFGTCSGCHHLVFLQMGSFRPRLVSRMGALRHHKGPIRTEATFIIVVAPLLKPGRNVPFSEFPQGLLWAAVLRILTLNGRTSLSKTSIYWLMSNWRKDRVYDGPGGLKCCQDSFLRSQHPPSTAECWATRGGWWRIWCLLASLEGLSLLFLSHVKNPEVGSNW